MKHYLKLLIFGTAFLSGCKNLNNAPITHLYVVDVQHNICGIRVITDKDTLSSRLLEEVPLYRCDGVVGLNMQEFLKLRKYLKDK
jgi:hypothetical protein